MSANTEAQGSGRGLEAMKWVVVAVLLIVAAVTAVMSLILWGLDGILVRLVSFITGLRF